MVYDTLVGILDETFQVEPEMIRADATLADMELDSLDVAELAAILEDRFGAKVTGRNMGKGSTLREVAEVIDGGIDGERASVASACQ
ncbi:acyl carrier protein [Streptomyces sp. RKAG293]|uniref:acyl carrier protein n=1 Tax=Streptomyces sp. RKAG293 TaxID=2893403 RepID=UPI0020332AD8|nr:acyl carrier protein [Streptomyces sp. RKAG293]MCM2422694.1 acyl carrier protein [Streptomyces sp. RKAG293]